MQRSEWMSVLALSQLAMLDEEWERLDEKPRFAWIRQPEFASVMLRAQARGAGPVFNAGEVAITRCALQLEDQPHLGVGYVVGRSRRHATLVALFDALAQGPQGAMVQERIGALRDTVARRRAEVEAQARRSAVDFAMLLRTEEA